MTSNQPVYGATKVLGDGIRTGKILAEPAVRPFYLVSKTSAVNPRYSGMISHQADVTPEA